MTTGRTTQRLIVKMSIDMNDLQLFLTRLTIEGRNFLFTVLHDFLLESL